MAKSERGALLGCLLADDDSSSDEEDGIVSIQITPSLVINVRTPEDFRVPSTLFASNVWSGATIIAEHLATNPKVVEGKRVVEFGSGSGVPGIVAAKLGARSVCLTDFPNVHLLGVLRENLMKGIEGLSVNASEFNAIGHRWGESCKPIMQVGSGEGPQRYDVAIASECLWCHDQHENLLASIAAVLKPGGIALVTFSHHVPGCEQQDLAFFEKAKRLHGFTSKSLASFNRPSMWSDKLQQTFLRSLHKPKDPSTPQSS